MNIFYTVYLHLCNIYHRLVLDVNDISSECLCSAVSGIGLFGFKPKTELKNRNQSCRFLVFLQTDRRSFSENRSLEKPNKPNRTVGLNRTPRPTRGSAATGLQHCVLDWEALFSFKKNL